MTQETIATHAEFDDYPLADLPPMPEGFVDSSWHNDTCPSYLDEAFGLQVFMDYVDPAKRESAIDSRFHVQRVHDDGSYEIIFQSDAWADVLNCVETEKTRIMGKEAADAAIERRDDDERTSDARPAEMNLLEKAIRTDDMHDAIGMLLDALQIKSGDVAAQVLSGYEHDLDAEWAKGPVARRDILTTWLTGELIWSVP